MSRLNKKGRRDFLPPTPAPVFGTRDFSSATGRTEHQQQSQSVKMQPTRLAIVGRFEGRKGAPIPIREGLHQLPLTGPVVVHQFQKGRFQISAGLILRKEEEKSIHQKIKLIVSEGVEIHGNTIAPFFRKSRTFLATSASSVIYTACLSIHIAD